MDISFLGDSVTHLQKSYSTIYMKTADACLLQSSFLGLMHDPLLMIADSCLLLTLGPVFGAVRLLAVLKLSGATGVRLILSCSRTCLHSRLFG